MQMLKDHRHTAFVLENTFNKKYLLSDSADYDHARKPDHSKVRQGDPVSSFHVISVGEHKRRFEAVGKQQNLSAEDKGQVAACFSRAVIVAC